MIRYLLDSGIASDFINRRGSTVERAKNARLRGDRIGIPTPVLGELIAGIENSNNPPRNLSLLWDRIRPFAFWTFDKPAAIEFGRIQAELWRRGRNIQIPDVQIAAIALALGNCVVVSKDNDFQAIPELKVEDWSR